MSSVNSEVHHEALIDRITVLNVYYNVYRIRLIRLNFTNVKLILSQCEIVSKRLISDPHRKSIPSFWFSSRVFMLTDWGWEMSVWYSRLGSKPTVFLPRWIATIYMLYQQEVMVEAIPLIDKAVWFGIFPQWWLLISSQHIFLEYNALRAVLWKVKGLNYPAQRLRQAFTSFYFS